MRRSGRSSAFGSQVLVRFPGTVWPQTDQNCVRRLVGDLWREYLGTANTELIEYVGNCARGTALGS